MKPAPITIAVLLASFACFSAARSGFVQPTCFSAAATRYGVPELLLRAIAQVESGSLRSETAVGRNPNGTEDLGRMQINTIWLPVLLEFGITRDRLMDECVSIHVGAWILAQEIERHGYGWAAVGAYNVGCRSLTPTECTHRRNRYAWKVHRALRTLMVQDTRP